MHEQPNLLIAWLEQAGLSRTFSVPITYTLIIFRSFSRLCWRLGLSVVS